MTARRDTDLPVSCGMRHRHQVHAPGSIGGMEPVWFVLECQREIGHEGQHLALWREGYVQWSTA